MGPCVNIGFLVEFLFLLFCRISTLIWIAGIKTQNTFWANELDNTTVLLELKHTCYVSLLMNSFISDSFFFSIYSIYLMVLAKTI